MNFYAKPQISINLTERWIHGTLFLISHVGVFSVEGYAFLNQKKQQQMNKPALNNKRPSIATVFHFVTAVDECEKFQIVAVTWTKGEPM